MSGERKLASRHHFHSWFATISLFLPVGLLPPGVQSSLQTFHRLPAGKSMGSSEPLSMGPMFGSHNSPLPGHLVCGCGLTLHQALTSSLPSSASQVAFSLLSGVCPANQSWHTLTKCAGSGAGVSLFGADAAWVASSLFWGFPDTTGKLTLGIAGFSLPHMLFGTSH